MDLYVLARSAGMMGKIAAGHGQIDSLSLLCSLIPMMMMMMISFSLDELSSLSWL
jgi:hypothetical protein